MRGKWAAGSVLCSMALAAQAVADPPGALSSGADELSTLRASEGGRELRGLAGGGGQRGIDVLSEGERLSLSSHDDAGLRSLAGGDDPQGKDMGAGWCGAHGNYSGPSCPKCGSPSPGSDPGASGSTSTRFLVILALAFLVILCVSVVIVL